MRRRKGLAPHRNHVDLFPHLLEIIRGKEEEAARFPGPTGIFVGFVFLSTVCRSEGMNKRTRKDLLFSHLGSTAREEAWVQVRGRAGLQEESGPA